MIKEKIKHFLQLFKKAPADVVVDVSSALTFEQFKALFEFQLSQPLTVKETSKIVGQSVFNDTVVEPGDILLHAFLINEIKNKDELTIQMIAFPPDIIEDLYNKCIFLFNNKDQTAPILILKEVYPSYLKLKQSKKIKQ